MSTGVLSSILQDGNFSLKSFFVTDYCLKFRHSPQNQCWHRLADLSKDLSKSLSWGFVDKEFGGQTLSIADCDNLP
jgi:hypothetical protein